MDVFIQFAIAASQFAMDDAKLTIAPEVATRVGVFIASGIGGFGTIEREHKAFLDGGPRRISPFFIPASIINLAAGPGLDPLRCEGAELGDVHGVLGVGACDRRRVGSHPAQRRGRDDRGRIGSGDHRDGRRRVRGDARAVDAQRRAASARAVRSTRIATDSSWARGRASSSSRSSSTRERRGASIYAELVGYGQTADALPHHGAVGRRRRRHARHADGGAQRRHRAAAGRLHQRARHLDPLQRQARDAGDQAALRRARDARC